MKSGLYNFIKNTINCLEKKNCSGEGRICHTDFHATICLTNCHNSRISSPPGRRRGMTRREKYRAGEGWAES